jgi:replicative DNA helicase
MESSILTFPNKKGKNFSPDNKLPPHSTEAEQATLGGLMLKSEVWVEIADLLHVEDFYHIQHKLIFAAIRELLEENHACNIITVKHKLEQQGSTTIDNISVLEYLDQLINNTPNILHVAAYAQIVRRKSVLRRLINVADKIAAAAYDPSKGDESKILDQAEQMIFAIAEHGQKVKSGFIGIKDVLTLALDRIDFMYQQGESVTGVATGFKDFDELTSGLQNSDLIIIAGRPSMGKTSFAMNIAEHVVIKLHRAVAVFSMEMSAEQLGIRLIASVARVNQQKVRTGNLEDEDWARVTQAISTLQEAQLFIDDTPALNPLELRSRARRLARENDLGAIIIDYIQLMQGSGRDENRTTEVSEISRNLKALAKELNIPVIALSQLNRSVESRSDKRPMMSDLRESGSIEQDADVIVFIYRDEVYHEDSMDKGIAEIIISKQRNGPIGTVKLAFLGHLTKFENYTDTYNNVSSI